MRKSLRISPRVYRTAPSRASTRTVLPIIDVAASAGRNHIVGLQALVALTDHEFHALAVAQYPMPLAPDRTEVHENIVSAVAGDEPEAFTGIEPFDTAALAR